MSALVMVCSYFVFLIASLGSFFFIFSTLSFLVVHFFMSRLVLDIMLLERPSVIDIILILISFFEITNK